MDSQANILAEPNLGELPSNWKVDTLGNNYEIQQGKALSKRHREGKSPSLFLRTSNVLWGRLDLSTIDEMDFTDIEREKLRLEKGDLLICEGGDIGRTAIWDGELSDCYYQNHVFRVRAKDDGIYPLFHMFWMDAAINLLGQYRGYGNKTTIPNLSKTRLSSFPIPLPSLPEQRAISQVLTTVRQAIVATERVIDAARELKRSMRNYLFTYGLIPIAQADQVKLKETEIGVMPESWDILELGKVATLQRGKDLPSYQRVFGKYPIVGSNGLVGYHNSYISQGKGVFVGRSGSVGKVTRINSSYWPLNTTLWVKDFHGNDEDFIYYLLLNFDFSKFTAGVSVPTLNRNLVHPIQVGIPDTTIQKEIANILDIIENKILIETRKANLLKALFQSLLHHLMTGKVRVGIKHNEQTR